MPHAPQDLGYIEAELLLLAAEEGGRGTPVRSGYRPNWWLLVDGERVNAGGIVALVGLDELAPGGSSLIRIYPFLPDAWGAVGVGTRLEASEGPRLVGQAVVTKVVPAVSLARGA